MNTFIPLKFVFKEKSILFSIYLTEDLGRDFGTILRASKTILALRYVLADKKLFWKGFGVRYGDQLVS